MDLNHEYRRDVEGRLKGIVWIIAAFFLIVSCRLFYLQIIKGEYYQMFSENNSIKEIAVPALRGIMFDRKGLVIVDNRPVFNLVVIPQYVTNRVELASSLEDITGIDSSRLLESINKAFRFPAYKPYVIVEDINFEIVSKLKARKMPIKITTNYNIDGAEISYQYVRDYPMGDIAPHLLGYVREIDEERLLKVNKNNRHRYFKGDAIGVNGVEEAFDYLIRGDEGLKQTIVDAFGRAVTYSYINMDLADQPARMGGNIYLTIDLKLQELARELLKDFSGAIVALDPKDGAVLAIYSSPSYDLNKLSSSGRNQYWRKLITDERMPLYNRAVMGTYPPASTYKIVTALAALKEGLVTVDEKITCNGGLQYGSRRFGCWKSSGHGPVNIVDAITRSCDVFFYKMGLRLGVDKLAEYAKELGLAVPTGIEIRGEKSGLIPSSEWKLKYRKAKWNEGETLSVAIGQGYNLVTPLQMASLVAAISNGGYRVEPHVVRRILGENEDELYTWRGGHKKIDVVTEDVLKIIQKGLINVTEGDYGTAGGLRHLNSKIAGKTGTAEVVNRESATGKPEHKTHAWFVGYAPYDNPQIAVAVIVEHGGHGSSAAAPVAGKIIKQYLDSHLGGT